MIQNIEIDGYRLLDGFVADFRPLNIVIGANSVGKSTLLDCLQCIAECTGAPLNTVIGRHWGMSSLLNASGGRAKVSWKIRFQKPANPIRVVLPLENQLFLYEVILQQDMQGQAQSQYEVLCRAEPLPGYTERFKYLEATPFRRQIYSRAEHRLVPFDQAISQSDIVRETADDVGKDSPVSFTPPRTRKRSNALTNLLLQ
jgi:energy-coupling factor transporter ATP-binding protein EcfA2